MNTLGVFLSLSQEESITNEWFRLTITSMHGVVVSTCLNLESFF